MVEGGTGWPRPGTVIALLALVLVIAGGSAYAGTKLANNSVKAKHIAKNAVTNKHTQGLTVAPPRNVRAFANIESKAPRITLLKRGPFKVFARCYAPGAGVLARVYFANSRDGAVGRLGPTAYDGQGNGTYLPKTAGTAVSPLASAAESQAANFDWAISAISGRASMQASVTAYLKGGTLPAGNGTYGAGKRCIFQATETGAG